MIITGQQSGNFPPVFLLTPPPSGGTAGCVVAGRLAEDPTSKILVIEAGQHNEKLESVHMVGG